MSRTKRSLIHTHRQKHTLKTPTTYSDRYFNEEIPLWGQYINCPHVFANNLPKWFRQLKHKKRRAKDREALYRELITECDGNFATWNCKDGEVWDYF